MDCTFQPLWVLSNSKMPTKSLPSRSTKLPKKRNSPQTSSCSSCRYYCFVCESDCCCHFNEKLDRIALVELSFDTQSLFLWKSQSAIGWWWCFPNWFFLNVFWCLREFPGWPVVLGCSTYDVCACSSKSPCAVGDLAKREWTRTYDLSL